MRSSRSAFVVAVPLAILLATPWAARAQSCVGDCNGDHMVVVNELVTGVNIALSRLPIERCPAFDRGGHGTVTVDDLVAAVSGALSGCGPANRAPHASDVTLSAEATTPYVEKPLIGSDPDDDTITFELIGEDSGAGYRFAYVNPETGVLYVTLAADFEGTIELPYHVTDGALFSNTAHATIEVRAVIPNNLTGAQNVDPKVYASFPRGFYDGTVLGAPGLDPALPSSVDLSDDFPLPGDQGRQNSCVGWALGYAIRTYQERAELGWSLEAPEHRFSPAYIYNQINGGRDQGSVYSEGLDLVVDQGVATLARVPYDQNDFLSQPSPVAHQEAAQFRARSWKTANGTLEIKDALANRLGVFFAIQVFGDLQALHGPDSVYNSFGGGFRGGHAVAVVGYDDDRYGGAFRIINSWSQNWGDGGYFWLPYAVANQIVATPDGPTPVLLGAVVLDDLPDAFPAPPDPVDPPLPAELPDLQITKWTASFNGVPGGAGSLQYTVANTGVATAPAGAYVALILSHDPTFAAGNTLVVYEPIPFAIAPGTTAFRDEHNAIAFNFPEDIQPGEYYMALRVDPWGDILESIETDNISPAENTVQIVNTLSDLEVLSWYAVWDGLGNGLLTYDLINNGASTAPFGWLITLALSPDDYIGDGDEIFLFSEPANFAVVPGGTLYRDDTIPASFSLFTDYFGQPVPTGVYYLALWLDPNGFIGESNEINNASLSWGTVAIDNGLGPLAPALRLGDATAAAPAREAYNGKVLPDLSVRKVRISATAQGGRRIDLLDTGPLVAAAPRLAGAAPAAAAKVVRARQQVIFPVIAAQPMPPSR